MAAFFTDEGQAEMLNAYVTAIGSGIKLGLFTANSSIGGGKTVILANLTPANFSGYAAIVPTWAAGVQDVNSKWTRDGGTNTFAHNGGGISNTVLGYYLYNATVGVLLFWENFSAPIVMAHSTDTIPIDPTWYMGDCTTPL